LDKIVTDVEVLNLLGVGLSGLDGLGLFGSRLGMDLYSRGKDLVSFIFISN
jgi:hypothetical protein